MSPYREKQLPLLVRLKQNKPLMDADANVMATTANTTRTADGHEPHATDQPKTMNDVINLNNHHQQQQMTFLFHWTMNLLQMLRIIL